MPFFIRISSVCPFLGQFIILTHQTRFTFNLKMSIQCLHCMKMHRIMHTRIENDHGIRWKTMKFMKNRNEFCFLVDDFYSFERTERVSSNKTVTNGLRIIKITFLFV